MMNGFQMKAMKKEMMMMNKNWYGGQWTTGEYVVSSADDNDGRTLNEILDNAFAEVVVVMDNGAGGLFSDANTEAKDKKDLEEFIDDWNDTYYSITKQKFRLATEKELDIISRYHDGSKVVAAAILIDTFTKADNIAMKRMQNWLQKMKK